MLVDSCKIVCECAVSLSSSSPSSWHAFNVQITDKNKPSRSKTLHTKQ